MPKTNNSHPGRPREQLIADMQRLLMEINAQTAPHVATVPMALVTELAALLAQQTNQRGFSMDIFGPGIHNYLLAHGVYHSALEADPPEPEVAWAAARIILAHAEPTTVQRFLDNHPECAPHLHTAPREPRP